MTYKKTKGLIQLIIFLLASISSISQTKPKEQVEEYKIENKVVSLKEYNRFKDSLQLKEIEGTYVCKKMLGGGENSYLAKDKSGMLYLCKNGVRENKSYHQISKK